MERPKTSNKKMSWFSIASIFLLAVTLAVGVSTNAQAATGSFDRDNYLPSLNDTYDYDRAWLTVTDSSITTVGTDNITVSVKSGANSIAFVLKETGSTSTVFTTTASTQPGQIGVGTTSGYVSDFSGSYRYPALGVSTQSNTPGLTALNLKSFVTQNGGDATNSTDGNLNVASGDTLQLLYAGSTLDTAVIGFNGAANSTITFTKGSAWGNSSTQAATSESVNVIVSVSDPDENLNPKMKDCIGFKDGFTSGLTGTATSRVQVEAIDQNTGNTFTLGGTSTVARNIMLVETGNNTGIFTAQGKVYGTATADTLRGNIYINSGTTTAGNRGGTSTTGYVYTGDWIALGSTTSSTALSSIANSDTAVSFRILEVTASGRLGLIFPGTVTTANSTNLGIMGTATLAYRASTTTATPFSGYGTSSWSGSKVVAVGTNTCAFGDSANGAASLGTGTSKILKLIDGSDYCLVQIGTFTTSVGGTVTSTIAVGDTWENTGAGSITVSVDSFLLFGPRNGDTVKASYLDALNSGGSVGTVTSVTTLGVSGETGTLSADKTTADINDFLVVTVVDGNLNTSASLKESVSAGSALYGGTATSSLGTVTSRGDRLTVAAYSRTGIAGIGSNTVGLSHPDGFKIGTQTIRISNTDNSLVWMVPTSLTYTGFGDPMTAGTSSFGLGTQSTSTIPLIKGTTSTADSFLNSASTLSLVATTDAADNTVEISPDGTHWVAIPVVEQGVNSSTFIGTIGFDCTAARITTSTTRTAAATFSDFTGTSSISFSSEGGNTSLNTIIGTGSVVRISDGTFAEVKEVTGVSGSLLSVEKLSNSSFYTPWKTWVQVVGNDLDNNRLDTTSAGSSVFRIGGYYGATYRVRYNDASGASNAYLGGDTLAATTSNFAFQTNTGVLSVSPSGTVGLNSQIEVVLVDDDLNVSTVTANATLANLTTTFLNLNEAGLGNPSGTSSAANNTFKNSGIAKQILVSRATSVTSTSFADASNTVTLTLTETGANSGTFKGTYKLSSGSDTTGAVSPPILKASNGDTITVFYNDSPSATAENNLSSYTTVSMLGQGGLGTLSLSKSEAFLSGDSVVVTLSDNDQNTTNAIDSATVSYKSSSAASTSFSMTLTETAANSGTFKGTLRTSTSSSASTTPPTVRAVADGTITLTYADASPAADVTAAFSTKNYGAVLAFGADDVALGSSIGVSLYDPETNTAITQADLVNISIKSTTDSAGTTLRLTETGNDTGSFLGTIAVSSDSSLLNTRIKAAVGDTLTSTFTDSPNASASISTVTDTATVAVAVTPTPVTSPTPGASPTATPVTSPTATPVASPTPPTVGDIIGTVLDAVSAAPISGAIVSTDTGGYTATADATGSYRLGDVAVGNYLVTASATGYDSSSQPVTVTAGIPQTVNFSLIPSAGTPTPPPPITPTPTVTPTPPVCETDTVTISKTTLTLKRKKNDNVTVTVTGVNDCEVAGETVTATINAAGKKRIRISPTSAATDQSGAVTFTITAKKKTGNARVTFKAGSVKKSMTVKVRK